MHKSQKIRGWDDRVLYLDPRAVERHINKATCDKKTRGHLQMQGLNLGRPLASISQIPEPPFFRLNWAGKSLVQAGACHCSFEGLASTLPHAEGGDTDERRDRLFVCLLLWLHDQTRSCRSPFFLTEQPLLLLLWVSFHKVGLLLFCIFSPFSYHFSLTSDGLHDSSGFIVLPSFFFMIHVLISVVGNRGRQKRRGFNGENVFRKVKKNNGWKMNRRLLDIL